MLQANTSVVNLTKVLYEEYNGRPLEKFPSFGLYLELVYTKENLLQLLNLVYGELCELKGEKYSNLSSLEEVKNFSKSKGLLNLKPDDDSEFLEESLVELCLARMASGKRLHRNLEISAKKEEHFDDYVLGKLNELKLTDLEPTSLEEGNKRDLAVGKFEESELEELRALTESLSKDYFSRWNAYLERFYNLLDVFFKVKEFKESKELEVLLETLKAWRENTKFTEFNLYDAYTYKPLVIPSIKRFRDHTNVTKISSKTNKTNRVLDLYNKVKAELNK